MKKHFLNEQRNRDDAAKKSANTSGVGKVIIIMRISIYILHPLRNCHPYFSTVWMTEVWMTIVESGWNLWVLLMGVVSRRWM